MKTTRPVGLVTYYWTYATFRAARRLYLEDLFVPAAARGRGCSKRCYPSGEAGAGGGRGPSWNGKCWTGDKSA